MPDEGLSGAGFAGAIGSWGKAAERAEGPRSVGRGTKAPSEEEYVDVILRVAAGDPSIARVLREICGLDAVTRAAALGLVAAHLRTRNTAQDVLDCVALLRQDAVARRIAEVLATPAAG
jgi:hypothetical protein